MNIDYKIKLILIYLNTVKEDYTYKEMTELMGLGYNIIDELIDEMKEKKLIVKDEYCIIKLSEQGKEILNKSNLLNTDIYNLYEDYKLNEKFRVEQINIEDMYIPKKFDKYFKGYNI